jgi:hypothetical protein
MNEKRKDIIKKGHFKNYDEYYYSDEGYSTGTSDSEEEASSRASNKKMVDSVQKFLWKKAKVDDQGNYSIHSKDWKKFMDELRKDIEKYGAKSKDWPEDK